MMQLSSYLAINSRKIARITPENILGGSDNLVDCK